MQTVTTEPVAPSGRSCRNSSDGLPTGNKTRVGHFENADLICRAKAVFGRPDDPVIVMPVAFEIEDGVDDMFKRFRARRSSLLL